MTNEPTVPLIANTEEAKTVSLGPNRVVLLLRADETDGRYSLTEFTLAPPPAPGPPMHGHEAEDELTYVLEGQIECVLEERSERASVGSFFFVPKGTPHTLSNPGPSAARILVILTPPWVRRLLGGSLAAVGEHRGRSRPRAHARAVAGVQHGRRRAGAPLLSGEELTAYSL